MPTVRLTHMLAMTVAFLASPLPCCRAGAMSAAADGLPRYEVPVGRVLTYAFVSTAEGAGPADPPAARGTVRAMVLAANADGSRRVVVRRAHTAGDDPEEVVVDAFDLFPDGRARPVGRPNPNAGAIDPSSVFPPLPPDGAAAAGEWRSGENWQGGVTTYTAAQAEGGGPDEFVFTGEDGGPLYRVYEFTNTSTLRFDRRKGIVIAGKFVFSQRRGTKQTTTGTQTLEKDERIDPARAAVLAAAYGRLFRARAEYHETMQRVSQQQTPERAAALADEAKALLAAGMNDVAGEAEVVKEFERKLAKHGENAPHDVEEARVAAGLVGKPVADWQAQDLDGKAWSREGLKGKVVVMDFWFRGCGWCVYAMPHVKQLAADYKDRPVVVLGMNADRREEDARHVVKALDLDYPQLKVRELTDRFSVDAYPTLLIIDQDGVLRAVYSGYSPDLRERAATLIDELLRK